MTTLNSCLSSERVVASLVHVHRNGGLILTSDFNTIHVPNELSSRTGRSSVSLQRNLFANANSFDRRNNCSNVNNINNIDVQRVFHRAVAGSSRHHILLKTSSIRGGVHRRTGSNSIEAIARPGVFHILIVKAVEVGVQHNHAALANFHLVSGQLEVSTKLIDCDIGGSNTTEETALSRQRINTRQSSLQSGIVARLRTRPCKTVLISFNSSRNKHTLQNSGIAIADGVVAHNCQLRNCMNFERLVCIGSSLHEAHIVSGLCREIMLTGSKNVHRKRVKILSGNLNAVHIPRIIVDNSRATRINRSF